MMKIHVLRAEELWQQAGAYYVRIQAMARQYHITLREEFDEHDTPKAKYIVLLDDEFPVATCRLYELSGETFPSVMLGRDVAVGFYEKLGYEICDGQIIHGDTFDCVRMEKIL